MKMPKKQVNVGKLSNYSLVINSLQIVMTAIIVVCFLFTSYFSDQINLMRIVVTVAAVLVIWGAVVDIRDAIDARKSLVQIKNMAYSIENIESLNQALRVQRHDFLNHLQVVYSLMEMHEYQEANAYIETVYGDISALSSALKTKNAAVNALLRVKFAQMDKENIHYDVFIRSTLENMPIPGWEMCRILSNLLDNAIDALSAVQDKRITITLSETLKQYTFEIANNGPAISRKVMQILFLPGVTTKKEEGHGMGLHIVKKTLEAHGGEITVTSREGETIFSGFIPKAREAVEDTM